MAKKYNIGLDIGTSSVGWAVVEENTQKIIRKGKGKNSRRLWGVRLFDQANTASERRNFRGTRRRYDRRRERIRLLQEEFESEINKVDPNFFTKLKESFFNEKDTVNKTIKLSNNEKEEIKKYQQQYKTIYHVRKELIENDKKMDIRLIYLAIHHIIKYRGNFLYNNDEFRTDDLDIEGKLKEIFKEFDLYYEEIDFHDLSKAVLNISKNDRKVLIQQILNDYEEKNFINEFIKMINGNKFKFIKMLNVDSLEEVELSFNDSYFDEKYDELALKLGDHFEKLQSLKSLYDMIVLKNLFNGSNSSSISSLMVERYVKHGRDLKFIKLAFRNNRILYNKIFKTKKNYICLYDRYIKNDSKNKISYDEFVKELKALLLKLNYCENEDILKMHKSTFEPQIDNGCFLPKITDTDNGKYPYQLNKDELIKIIEKQGKYYPFLKKRLDNGEYKLVQLLKFKIPYYVGPLVNKERSKFAWMVRKVDHVKITPYNFEEVVNKEETAEEFIKRMIGHCTYFLGEYAMANNSILYSKYKVMNELKQIRVNGEKIKREIQHKIIEDLFMKTSGTITDKVFKEYLYSLNEFRQYNGNISVTGYSSDNRFANNMQSYVDFFGNDGIFVGTNYTVEDADRIIELITIFVDKDILEEKVKRLYPELTFDGLKKILSKKYKGWGSLSKAFLTKKYYKDKYTEIYKSVLDLMYETDENFMQIINNDEYKFQSMIKEYNKVNSKSRVSYELVENLATSPATKRGIYQALKVLDEIVKYMRSEPSSIIIEMARGENINIAKKRKDDKKNNLLKLYEKSKKQIEDYNILIGELNSQEKIDSQKLFLYFIQLGKSLYSGRPLNIEDLDTYEIDHIIPRTLIKDDSIDNKALVFREENQAKAASYVLPREFRTERNKHWWHHLKEMGLMSTKKFQSLIRDEYRQEDIERFINRQLVETRQITKHVANILSSMYNESNVIYLNASLTHNYRERYELFKFREINDYHHAHDAYLTAVLGEYKEKYLKKKIDFEKLKYLNKKLIENKDYKKIQYGYVINSLDSLINNELNELTSVHVNTDTGEVLFDTEAFNRLVEYNLYCNDIIISKKVEFKTGEFYNQTIYKKDSIEAKQPLKKGLSTKLYGGYNSVKCSYMMLIKYKIKNKTNISLIGIPILLSNGNNSKEKIDSYIKSSLKCNDYIILREKIPYNIEILYKSQLCSITGFSIRGSELINATQLRFSKEEQQRYKYLFNFIFNSNKEDIDSEKIKKFDEEINLLYHLLVEKIITYYPLYTNFSNNLLQAESSFVKLPLVDSNEISKVKVIKEICKLLKFNSANANLKSFNSSVKFSDSVGRMSGTNIKNGVLIFKSVAGLMESRYEF